MHLVVPIFFFHTNLRQFEETRFNDIAMSKVWNVAGMCFNAIRLKDGLFKDTSTTRISLLGNLEIALVSDLQKKSLASPTVLTQKHTILTCF